MLGQGITYDGQLTNDNLQLTSEPCVFYLIGRVFKMKMCYFCGKELDLGSAVGRHETCPHCHRDLRCCLNCSLYAVSSSYCREPQSEEIRDRYRSNFCDFFIFGDKEAGDEKAGQIGKSREEWEQLFRK